MNISRAGSPSLQLPQLLIHALHIGSAVLIVLAAVIGAQHQSPWHAAAILLLCAMLLGFLLFSYKHARRPREHSQRSFRYVFAGATLVWLGLIALTPAGVWVAFPVFFMQLFLLRWYHALIAVALTALSCIGAYALHTGTVGPGQIIGPLMGAAVAVLLSQGFRALSAEVAAKSALIAELERTQKEHAELARQAGMIAERERLMTQLHDSATQELTSIILLLEAAKQAPDLTRQQHLQDTALSAAAASLASIRNLLHPTPGPLRIEVSEIIREVVAAQQDLVADALQLRTRLDVSVAVHERLADAIRSALTTVITNARLHAAARTVVVTCSVDADTVLIDVVDDGCGFAPDMVAGSALGLRGLRSRLAAIGARMHIESAPNQGTAVALTFPLGQQSAGQTSSAPLT